MEGLEQDMDILDCRHSIDCNDAVCWAVLEAEERPKVHDRQILGAPRSSSAGHTERESVDWRTTRDINH